MHKIERSALVRHSAIDMFHLVNDVASYPTFLKWCKSSKVLSETAESMTAELEVAWKVLHKIFSTKNQLKAGESIKLELLDGPFESMYGEWHFKHLRDDACKITMEIDFEFKSSVSNFVFSTIFGQICGSLMDSFIKRADEIYG
ncbi:MAG: type II toxin-antitoxin system RatA family toxin [Cycloclasticus sp.]|jgi:ribosome-associated toxin RatA of RatAB toxin-antitoxin module|nr:MAG: cyclase [Cycloclasticus sp. Phe_18]MBV1912355.1 type II toxin-antitoxin system RatA family toxin [Cycloclasticus sp.]MDF1688232.1 type II toxin-antitoxin system RatA family toxin [Cycloclasticus sp.]MEE4290365.1 type II toxin-antitoxin system RatA family toxin [Cycloclasticus sp.]